MTSNAKPPEKTISCVSCRKRKLKCDRVKPKCGTCTRLRHECEFPERRRNQGSKRRNIKELEARLAQVETQLITESKQTASVQTTSIPGGEMDWNAIGMDMNLDLDLEDDGLLDPSFDISQPGLDFSVPAPTMPTDYFGSYELIGLGLQEALPPQDIMDELHHIYFEKHHPTMPMIHKLRYYASLDRAPHMRPPICLRYAMWTVAASLSDKYSSFEDIFYERARRYLQDAEMKGHGESFVSVYYAQAWSLIATYEASKTLFSRAWMSVGRACRLSQMLGLHRLDGDDTGGKNILPPPKDWIEFEERRRTFWAAFYGDRWASSGTGWPMVIDDNDISTNLPASEEAFENGVQEETISLQQALTPEGAAGISSFGGVIISATLFGNNYQHLRKKGPDEHPEDLANGEFWRRHRKMDNVLSNTFMFLPDHLRLPQNIRDMNVVFLHMNIHAACICLHQAAILTAKKHGIDPNFIEQSRNRNIMAAEEITNIMRLISHMDASSMSSWMGFCLYVAGGIFIQDLKSERPRSRSSTDLEFLVLAMRAIGTKHSITNHFTAQLELDMNAAGVSDTITECPVSMQYYPAKLPVPMRIFDDLNTSFATSRPSMTDVLEDLTNHNIAARFKGDKPPSSFQGINIVPYVMNNIKERQRELGRDQTAQQGSSSSKTESSRAWTGISHGFPLETGAACPFEQDFSVPTGDTPSSDSSSSNKMQGGSDSTTPEPNARSYPYRHIDPSNHGAKPYGIFQADLITFGDLPVEWDVQNNTINFGNGTQEGNAANNDFTGFDNNGQPGADFHDFIGEGPWNSGS
ncbi:hypothetical protein N431DRAFT_444787 [Stipitochalara longipes BDJ]|nr:hypothetical protein N431DRAFT_444787 [Stipitochalara longipes BDJ]